MKKKTVGILLGMMMLSLTSVGCGESEATETAGESAAIVSEEEIEESEETESSEEADGETDSEEGTLAKVGILLPDESEESWKEDAALLQTALETKEYEAVVAYADGDTSKQVSQIQEMTDAGVQALIIAPVDEYGLATALEEISESKIPVFSYDDLTMDTDQLDYYVTFDQRKIGQTIGQAIVKSAELDKTREEKTSKTIEFLMGSTDDVDALFLYNGVMEVLQPYFDDGTLLCPSNSLSFDSNGILRWSAAAAKTQLDGILEEFYSEGATLDIVCTGFDGAACSAAEVLEEHGIVPGSEAWPVITGVGCEADAVKKIAEGKVSCSVFMDRGILAEACVKLVDDYIKGEDVEVNNKEQYDNGKKIVSTYTCDAHLITKDDYEVLIDSGVYTAEEVQPEALPSGTPVPAGGADEADARAEADPDVEVSSDEADTEALSDTEKAEAGAAAEAAGEISEDVGENTESGEPDATPTPAEEAINEMMTA